MRKHTHIYICTHNVCLIHLSTEIVHFIFLPHYDLIKINILNFLKKIYNATLHIRRKRHKIRFVKNLPSTRL